MTESDSSPEAHNTELSGPNSPQYPSPALKRNSARGSIGYECVRYVGNRFVGIGWIQRRIPARYRPTLFLDAVYNFGTGAFVSLFLLSTVVLKTVLTGDKYHLAALAAMFGGSSLLSPLVAACGRMARAKALIIVPNVVVAILLLCTALPNVGATLFTIVVGTGFVVRVFPRVSEMNLYRVVYPNSHRGRAVGLVKALAWVSGLGVTIVGYLWIVLFPQLYWVVFLVVGLMLATSTMFFARIPIPRRNVIDRHHHVGDVDQATPNLILSFIDGFRIFLQDRRFVLYQFGFALAGFANHMAMVFVAEVLREEVVTDWSDREIIVLVGFVCAVLPAVLMTISAPMWGRYLDTINPMLARSLFNTFQTAAYGLHTYGALTLQIWPFVLGQTLHAIGNGGGTINWLTGSQYFARPQNASLYNSIHVGFTGLRGLIAAPIGLIVFHHWGVTWVFGLATGLSALGAIVMLAQGRNDLGPAQESV